MLLISDSLYLLQVGEHRTRIHFWQSATFMKMYLNITNDLWEKMPTVANKTKVPDLNAIPEVYRGIAECIGIGNFNIALGI